MDRMSPLTLVCPAVYFQPETIYWLGLLAAAASVLEEILIAVVKP